MWNLITKNCYLRDYGEEDRESFVRINTDPIARAHLNGPLTIREAHTMFEATLAETDPCEGVRWAVFERKSNEYLGHVFLVPWESRKDEMEWGMVLLPDQWGRGLEEELGEATLEECFSRRGFKRIVAMVNHEHVASNRCLKRLGFTLIQSCRDEAGLYDVYARDSWCLSRRAKAS